MRKFSKFNLKFLIKNYFLFFINKSIRSEKELFVFNRMEFCRCFDILTRGKLIPELIKIVKVK